MKQHVRGLIGAELATPEQLREEPGSDCAEAVAWCCRAALSVSSCTFHTVLPSCLEFANCQVTTDVIPLIHSLPNPNRAVLLLIIRGKTTVSSPAARSHTTAVQKSARRVNSYLDTYLGTYKAGCQSCRSGQAIRCGSASQPPPRACSTCVPRVLDRA